MSQASPEIDQSSRIFERLPLMDHPKLARAVLALLAAGGSFMVSPEADASVGYETSSFNISDGALSLDVYVRCDDRENLTPNRTAVGLQNKSGNGADVSATIKVGGIQEEAPNINVGLDNHNNIQFPTIASNLPVTVTLNSPSRPSRTVNSGCNYDSSKPIVDDGYLMVDKGGGVFEFGMANLYGEANGPSFTDIEVTSNTRGYWLANSIGEVVAKGAAVEFGDKPPLAAGEEVSSLSPTPTDRGYWLFTNRGRVIPYGDARHFGDMSAVRLNGPVLDSIPTPSGNGYYMVASDGGVFTFGDAKFAGSMGDKHLNKPVQSLVPDADGDGYWLVASDGGIFSFNAEFYGSMGSVPLSKPVNGMVGFPKGYMMVAEDGGIFNFGESKFRGSLGNTPLYYPITAVTAFNNRS